MNLFDTVPDKVIIYSKTSEASAPKSLYSNRQMNTFFGCDVVKSDAISRREKSTVTKAPSKRTIFSDHTT